jgi:hypothetical protein
MRGIKTSACPSPQLDPEITATPEAMESDIVRGSPEFSSVRGVLK